MPDATAQLKAEISPQDALDDRAWAYYYKNYSTIPVSAQLISLIKMILTSEAPNANPSQRDSGGS